MGAIKLIDLDQEIFVPIYDEAQDMTYEQIMTIGEMFDYVSTPAEAVRAYRGSGFKYLDYCFYYDHNYASLCLVVIIVKIRVSNEWKINISL